ncbi:MAG TPA: type II toxin-antitoxin system VapC family toxin [Euzebyales bacterium]|nr:type II toxin-antitoxin system VapC family toxin [Euzebyales bacterium]
MAIGSPYTRIAAVVDCSIVIRVLANRDGDDVLRQRLARTLHAPALIDAEVSSVVRGLSITTKPNVRMTTERAQQMLGDYAGLRIVRYPMQSLQQRAFALRHNVTAYDAMYVALAEALDVPLLTDDAKFAGASGHHATIESYPQ